MTAPERRTGAVRRRVLAYVADAVVLGAAVAVVGDGRARRVALGGALGLVYHVLLEGTYGQTIGKRLFGVAVVAADGGPCTYAAATVRTLARFVDALPIAYLGGFVAIALTERRQRLGDLLAGTVVVRTESAGRGHRN